MPEHWLQSDAAMFLRDFGEDVIVIDAPTSPPRTVRAIVDRLPPSTGPGGNRLDARIVLEMANDAVAGIDVAAVNLGKVRVRVGERLGVPVTAKDDRSVSMSDDADGWQDAGMIRVVAR